jgi:formate dehydrogenase major subunit
VRQIVPTASDVKTDWEVICEVGRAMGKGELFRFSSAQEVWEEVRQVWEKGHGITYGRIEQAGLQWPCLTETHPGTEILHSTEFASGSRAPLQSIDFLPTVETTDEQYLFVLITGRSLHQFNAGTMTQRTPNTVLRPADYLEISPEDASRLGLESGQRVRLKSRYGQAELPVRVTEGIRTGELFATFHTWGAALNSITGPYRDRRVDTPECKVTAVRIEKL